MQDLPAGRRLPGRLHDLGRVVLLPDERPGRLPVPLLRVQLPGRIVRQPVVPVLHEHGRALHASAALWRPAVRVPAGRGPDSEPRVVDGPDVSSRSQARRQVVQTAVLQVPRRRLARRRALPHQDEGLAGSDPGVRRLRRRPVQPVRRCRADLHRRGLPVQNLPAGRRLSGELSDLRRVVLLPDERPGRVPVPLLRVQLPPGCANLSCHCFTNMAVPCTPRLHSGDQPCVCPPAGAPIPSLS
jgi:hypothetical protein